MLFPELTTYFAAEKQGGLYLRPAPETLGAVGPGILLQSAALLVFDTIAHHRAEHYVLWLIALPPG